MRESAARLASLGTGLKALCAFLGVLVLLQLAAIFHEADPLAGLEPLPADPPASADVAPAAIGPAATGPATAKKPGAASPIAEPPPLPDVYKTIEASGVFGVPPQKSPAQPALIGIAGRHAIIQAPDGQVDLVPEGGELGGVKVLKIATNRVLIEHEGKKKELTIFSGMGSAPLLPEEKRT